MTKPVKCSLRQVNTAKVALKEKIKVKAEQMTNDELGKCPSYNEDHLWKEQHPSPRDIWEKKFRKTKAALEKKMEKIVLQAEMNLISADELYTEIDLF